MYKMLLWLYNGGNGKLTEIGLSNAVNKGYITEDEKKKILESAN